VSVASQLGQIPFEYLAKPDSFYVWCVVKMLYVFNYVFYMCL